MRSRRVVPAALTIALSLASAARAQAPIAGVVREDSSTRPLVGVEVSLEGRKRQTRTDADGKYLLDAPGGVQIVVFRMLGYQQLRMRVTVRRDTVHADATLLRTAAVGLDTVKVDAPKRALSLGREGFTDRKAMGFGKFIDSSALRARDDRRLSDVLAELTNIRLQDYTDVGSSIVEIRAISPISLPGQRQRYEGVTVPSRLPCWVSVFFDGSPLYRSDRLGAGKPPDFSRDFSVASLSAVEYYRTAAETPQQFGGANANCGALVLWSRTR